MVVCVPKQNIFIKQICKAQCNVNKIIIIVGGRGIHCYQNSLTVCHIAVENLDPYGDPRSAMQ